MSHPVTTGLPFSFRSFAEGPHRWTSALSRRKRSAAGAVTSKTRPVPMTNSERNPLLAAADWITLSRWSGPETLHGCAVADAVKPGDRLLKRGTHVSVGSKDSGVFSRDEVVTVVEVGRSDKAHFEGCAIGAIVLHEDGKFGILMSPSCFDSCEILSVAKG